MRAFLLGFLLVSTQAWADQDPLFAKMAGHWSGQGVRRTWVTHKTDQLQAVVDSAEDGDVLMSQNQITEMASDGSKKTYLTQYWVKAGQQPGKYVLGKPGSGQPTAFGEILEDGDFVVRQDLDSSVSIRSRTHFSGDVVQYDEAVLVNSIPQTETSIEYKRTAP